MTQVLLPSRMEVETSVLIDRKDHLVSVLDLVGLDGGELRVGSVNEEHQTNRHCDEKERFHVFSWFLFIVLQKIHKNQ